MHNKHGSEGKEEAMQVVLVGPGRIGEALKPKLEACGHGVAVLSRQDYGDFLAPHYVPDPAVAKLTACDALLLLAGRFELNGGLERMGQANATGPIRIAEAVHGRFPQAQVIAFLDSRIRRAEADLPEAVRDYVASKKRLAKWVVRVAKVWGEKTGARVNAIAPGPVFPSPLPGQREPGGACLTPRPTVEDIFSGVQFLLGTPSVTGQILYVAGGQQLL